MPQPAGPGGAPDRPAAAAADGGGPFGPGPSRPLVLGASVQGAAHARRGIACQDAFAWALLPGAGAVAAVADGAGSARWADAGARSAVEAAVSAAGEHGCPSPAGMAATRGGLGDSRPALAHAVSAAACAAAEAVRVRAADLGARPREFACTLLVVLWAAGNVAVAHVGDGAVVALRQGGGWEVLSEPAAGEYVNETHFLTDTGWRAHLRIATPEAAYEGVVAMSDGCQRAALLRGPDGRHRAFPGFLDPLGRFARRQAEGQGGGGAEIGRLLASPKLSRISDDDRTLVLLWRGAGDG